MPRINDHESIAYAGLGHEQFGFQIGATTEDGNYSARLGSRGSGLQSLWCAKNQGGYEGLTGCLRVVAEAEDGVSFRQRGWKRL